VRRPQLERHLVLGAKIDFLEMAALAQVPDVEPVAVVAFDQTFEAEPVLEHIWGAPLAADADVIADVPPEVVGEELGPRSTSHWPSTSKLS